MKTIHTVLGGLSPECLGFTQCHEHIMLTKGQSYLCNPTLCIDDLQKSTEELRRYYSCGGCCIVDAQPIGCNRDSQSLVELEKASGVHIIASTGFHKMQFYPEEHWIRKTDEDELAELFRAELTSGMYAKTDACFNPVRHSATAGIIKTALDRGDFGELYARLFRAAAKAQIATGAPMMVHIEKESDPERLVRFLSDYGVRTEKLYFCHMDRACDRFDTFLNVLKSGVTLEFDTIGRFKYHSDEFEVDLIKKILESGYEDSLLFSLDTTRARLKAYSEDAIGLDYILTSFVPMLRKAGVSDRQIEKISVETPRRILSW